MNKLRQIIDAYKQRIKASDASKFKKFILSILPSLILIFGIWSIIQILILVGFIGNYYMGILMSVMAFIILATSLNIATGFLGQLILGHAAFMGIGGYAAGIFAIYMRDYVESDLLLYVMSILVAFTFAAVAGFLIGTPALRLKGDYLGILTLGFGEIIRVAATNLSDLTGGAGGLKNIPQISTFNSAYFTVVIIILIIVLMMNSRFGRAMLSIREDEIAAESVGINLFKFKILGFVLAAGFGGIGGALFAFKGFISPNSISFMQSVNIFVIVVLGGIGSVTGSVISAIVLTILPQALLSFETWRMLVYSLLLILMMLFRPQGLLGTKELKLPEFVEITDWFKKRSQRKGEQA
ncbi:MAG: branched-chain amino acid ABC transporter permease [Acholeplasmataceae bacterium]